MSELSHKELFRRSRAHSGAADSDTTHAAGAGAAESHDDDRQTSAQTTGDDAAQRKLSYYPITHTHTHTRLTALFRDYPGEPVPEG